MTNPCQPEALMALFCKIVNALSVNRLQSRNTSQAILHLAKSTEWACKKLLLSTQEAASWQTRDCFWAGKSYQWADETAETASQEAEKRG